MTPSSKYRTFLPMSLLLVLLVPRPAVAQLAADDGPLSLQLGQHVVLVPHLQYRPRFLVHEGRDFREGDIFTGFSQRARLGLEARFKGWLSTYIEVQDVRLWGSETDTLGDYSAGGLDLHQGWLEVRCPKGLFVRAGRQEVNFDNQRLIGAVGWSDQGRSFDGIRLGYTSDSVQGDLLYALVLEEDAFVGSSTVSVSEDVHLLALRTRLSLTKYVRPTVVAIYDYQGPKDQHRATLGAYIDGEPRSGLSYSVETYAQVGKQRVKGVEKDLLGVLAAVGVGYTLPVPTSPGLAGWFEYLSGDDDPGDGTVHTFDTLYATNHKFYGFMDFFLNIPLDTDGLGLMDAGGRVSIKPAAGLLLFLDFHHFEQARKDPTWGTTTLGNELDFLARYQVNSYLALEGVFGAFFPKLGGSVRRMDDATRSWGKQTELYGYLQADLVL